MIRQLFITGLLACSVVLCGQCPTVELLSERLRTVHAPEPYPDCPTLNDSLSSAYHGLSVYNWTQGYVRRAISFGESALATQRLLYTDAAPGLPLGKSLHNLGRFYRELGHLNKSHRSYREAAATFEQVQHPQADRRKFASLNEAGYTAKLLGDFEEAERFYQLIQQDEGSVRQPRYLAESYLKLGDLFIESARYPEAINALQSAWEVAEESYDVKQQLLIEGSMANAYYKSGELSRASGMLDALLPKLKARGSYYQQSRMLSLALLVGVKSGEFSTAETIHVDNLAVANRSANRLVIAQAYDNGAELALAHGDVALAIERVTMAIATLVPGFRASAETSLPGREQLSASPFKVDLLIYLRDFARIMEAAEQPEVAIDGLVAAAFVTDEIRRGLGGTVSKLFWQQEVRPVYEQAIRICRQIGQKERAFEFFERSRSLLLYEALVEADMRATLPDSIDAELRDLENQLSTHQADLLAGKDGVGLRSVNVLRDSLLKFREAIAVRFPNTLKATTDVATITLAKARENLTANGMDRAIHFFLGQENTYAFSLTPEEVSLVDLGPSDELSGAVRSWLSYFDAGDNISQAPSAFLRSAHRLHQLLLAPALSAQTLNKDGRPLQLLIIPDGLLAYLPFAALVVKEPGQDATKADYLIRSSVITYAHSATVWDHQLRMGSADDHAIGFAPYWEHGNTLEPDLPASLEEMKALEEELGATTLLGESATKEVILQGLATAGTVHLATHAYASRDGREPPRILASDGDLYLSDIYSLEGGTHQLITLSACNGNLGKNASGEGVLSLGRALTAAGAGSVVTSLWSLNDQATAPIMRKFYGLLAGGMGKSQALRTAQMAYLDDASRPAYLRTPAYWAAFTSYGTPGQISVSKTNWIIWLAVGLAILLALYVATTQFLKSK